MTPVLVLVGAPGSGKTTVGRLVAQRLGVGFRDTDCDIAAGAGKPIPEIFIDDGEDHFRALERAAVADALATADGVVALGGGAVIAPETRQLLGSQTVAYLRVGLADAARRVGLARDRPVLAINPRAQLHRLLAERAPLYEEVATVTVDTDGRDPADVARDIVAALERS